jgi:hypothetical protein
VKHSDHCSLERLIVHYVGAFSLIGLGGLVWLVNGGRTPDGHIVALVGVVGTSIGGMLGFLMRGVIPPSVPKDPDAPQDVNVVNPPNQPVPVEEKP